MRILLFRNWEALNYGATYSSLKNLGVGGTEYQLLNHAKMLTELGHEVYVAGVSKNKVTEEGVTFLPSTNRSTLISNIKSIAAGIDATWLNTTTDLNALKAILPQSVFVQISQNGPHFCWSNIIDFYAMVGYGQMAYYIKSYPKYRQKIVPLVSVPAWESIYKNLPATAPQHQIIWVGAVSKQGLRQWGKAMSKILKKDPTLKWTLCVPSYDLQEYKKQLPEALIGLGLPENQIEFKNLTLLELAKEIAISKIHLVSLGGEDGPVSYLDGHAAGVPVLSGDDIVGKWYNPEGMGYRVSNAKEAKIATEMLLTNSDIAKSMGALGREWIKLNYSDKHLKFQVDNLSNICQQKRDGLYWSKSTIQSDKKFSWRYWLERIEVKLAQKEAK